MTLDDAFHTHWRLPLRLETIGDPIFAMVHSGKLSAASDPLIDRVYEVWRLISVSGLPAGNIVFPRNFAPWTVTGDRVLGALRDSLGVVTVQVYTLTPPQRLR